jgi:4-hydroxy-2-oxoheptanedioate aldolase
MKSFQDRQKELGRPLLGPVLTVQSTLVAMLAAQSFDWVLIDMEHSPFSAQQMTSMVHAVVAANSSCLPIVRVPSHDVEWIKWALDSGAAGIIVPMVNNASEMRKIIDNGIYPPIGKRSFGPFHAPFGRGLHASDMVGYLKIAQAGGVAILPIIESVEGLANCEELLAMEGVAGTFIGPFDLRLSMGLPGGADGPEPEFKAAIEKICAAGRKYGKMVGSLGTDPALARRRAEMGMTFLCTTIDYNVLLGGFMGCQKEMLKALEGQGAQSKLS